jgi:trimeric autotransporter adhesin
VKKRYLVLGLSCFLALALAVPALGGPSNPLATTSVSAKKLAKQAKKAAAEALAAANAAQTSANNALQQAQGAQSSANQAQNTATQAQNTANEALAEAQTNTGTKLGLQDVQGPGSANDSDSPKQDLVVCPAGKDIVSGQGIITSQTNATPVALTGVIRFYEANLATGREVVATAQNWQITAQGTCINE